MEGCQILESAPLSLILWLAQGKSGASASEREGFQCLVADVGLGRAGIVMGLEVSRLARNCADWHRLLEICALSHTLILSMRPASMSRRNTMNGYCWASRAHLTWDQFLGNQERLLQKHQACGGAERKAGPARAGPALLQGLVLCGKCGRAMTLRYYHRLGRLTPDYVCAKTHVEKGEPICQHIPGGQIDADVGHLLVQSDSPGAGSCLKRCP
jgi:Recombinase zinc beta ribbon domain/Resolvase, N terminal domain